MAAEAPQPPSNPGSARDLPAPYQDPYRALGHDLRAVVATLRLRVQELWRRNRQGDLSVPGFWPQDLAPLFWPAVVALVLASLLALPIGVSRLLPARAPVVSEPQPEQLLTTPLPQARPIADPQPVPDPEVLASAPSPVAPPPEPPQPEPVQPEPPLLALDPLMELLQQDDPRHLIASAHPQPSAGVLELELTDAFRQLPEPERRREAERWLERSRDQGYGSLVLVDAAGRPLGRQALVGSGMILLDSQAPS